MDRPIEVSYGLLIALSPLIYYPQIDNFSNLPKILFIHTIIFGVVILWICRWIKCSSMKVFIHPISIRVILWLMVSGITILWAVDKYSGFSLWLHWSLCAIGMMVWGYPVPSLEKIDRILLAACIGAGAVSFIGILQYIGGLDFIPQAFAPGATFSNKNIAAEFVCMIWPLSIMGFILADRFPKIFSFSVLSALMTVFLLYAQTRAVWVSLIVNGIAFGIFIGFTGLRKELKQCITRRKSLYILTFFIVVAVMATIPPFASTNNGRSGADILPGSIALASEPEKKAQSFQNNDTDAKAPSMPVRSTLQTEKEFDDPAHHQGYAERLFSIFKIHEGSANFRLTAWANTLRMIYDHWWGIGLGNWYVYYPLYQRVIRPDPFFSLDRQPVYLHNELLQIFAETSFIGLLCYLSIFITIFQILLSIDSIREPAIKIRTLFSVMAVGCYFVNSFFSFPLRMAIPPLYVMMLLSVIISLDLHSRTVPFFSVTIHKMAGYSIAATLLVLSVMFTVRNFRNISSDFHYFNVQNFHKRNNWKYVRSEAEKAIHDNPHGYKLWLELGIADNNLNLHDQAIAALQQALTIHPNHLNSLINISNACFQLNRFAEAADYMKRAIVISPNNERVHFNMGVIHEKRKEYPDAAREYEKALTIRDSYIEVRYRLALTHLHENRLNESLQQLGRIIVEQPDYRSAHYYRGLIYKKWNQKEKAAEAFRKEIEFYPDHIQALSELRELME